MFREHLQRMVENVEGGRGALLMGFDGIEIDAFMLEDAQGPDVKNVGMEFSFIFGQIRKAAELLEVGGIQEVTIKAAELVFVIRLLTEDYFIALTLGPAGNFGKARFLLRVTAPKILQDL